MNSMIHHEKGYYYFWGKATNDSWHPLIYHMLDVAAVGVTYLQQNPQMIKQFTRGIKLDDKCFLDLIGFLLALHDLGKFTPEFQIKNQRVIQALGREYHNVIHRGHHTNIGMVIWNQFVSSRYFAHTKKSKFLSKNDSPSKDIVYWVASTIGHHGVPVELRADYESILLQEAVPDEIRCEINSCIEDLEKIFPSIHKIFSNFQKMNQFSYNVKSLSFWISGLTILSDWLASSEDFFPLTQRIEQNKSSVNKFHIPMETYYQDSLKRSLEVLPKTGLLPRTPARNISFFSLFSELAEKDAKSTPLQKLAEELLLPSGAKLLILEDVTGAGKTEAAWLLAGRIMSSGEADGIYMGLPTMATSNGMYPRISKIYERFYQGDKPSLILSHSARKMHDDFQKSILNINPLKETYQDEMGPAGAYCASWLADMSKKSLLAQVGVGTIDQALLSVLRSKHNTLRLFGLTRKVLIIDEVHAYDSYTGELLANLIRFQTHIGGSIILLSATLPEKMRGDFIEAFADGVNQKIILEKKGDKENYPLLTMATVSSSQKKEGLKDKDGHDSNSIVITKEAVGSRIDVSRSVKTVFLYDINNVYQFIQNSAKSGKAVVWIRNTIKDAMEAFEQLKELSNDSSFRPLLFHSRFALKDRIQIETQVLDIFGKEGDPEERKGKVLVATQVVEQSLDLDFDEMVTDLCPIDLLLQRAGRLKRHTRAVNGQLLSKGNDERGDVILHIYAPPVDENITERWYASYFPGAAYVYTNHSHLWKTARLLLTSNGYTMPDDARTLIEGVYGEFGPAAPEVLYKSAETYRIEENENEILATRNGFDLNLGYIKDQNMQPWPEDKAPTRLGDDSMSIRLAIYEDGELKAYAGSVPHAWQLSEVRVPARFFYGMSYYVEIEKIINEAHQQMPDKGRSGRIIPLELNECGQDGKIYSAMVSLSNGKKVLYTQTNGLFIARQEDK